MRSRCTLLCVALCLLVASFQAAQADGKNGRLDLYFIDVEGGAATLLVTPAGESVLIDSGYPDNMGRDRDRILKVVREVAKLDHIDHAVVSHWHMDHYGNHASITAEIPIRTFWDRGIPDTLSDDKQFPDRIALYRAASQNESRTLHAGDTFEMQGQKLPLKVRVLTGSREVVPNSGEPNPFASEHKAKAEDKSDNAASLSLLFELGKFRFLTCGDLTWNVEAQLVTPNNPVGKVDLFMVTHHGLGVSNNPVFVKAIDPVVDVMCNGPSKGGDPAVIATLRSCPSFQALYQLHRNLSAKAEQQAPAEFIANAGDTNDCQGTWVKASVAPDGESYTVQIGPDGAQRTFNTRGTSK
ncbi:ComEC/Rec2 family competence protein [Planctomicrobium piriforme]|uniref:Metallo-beta-lactamase superfamily protein n=1 Tax=Planctomicrobium piriforme TaxID=1576369 RepID=A0A1I3RP97_9PLAN|nr:MBL fold metallo-hydrolase [Planctomicrobium piriforme]SFJ48078.1 Metallo-beta-lactamase superfamily protein [Planctomicrobium piriforme]